MAVHRAHVAGSGSVISERVIIMIRAVFGANWAIKLPYPGATGTRAMAAQRVQVAGSGSLFSNLFASGPSRTYRGFWKELGTLTARIWAPVSGSRAMTIDFTGYWATTTMV